MVGLGWRWVWGSWLAEPRAGYSSMRAVRYGGMCAAGGGVVSMVAGSAGRIRYVAISCQEIPRCSTQPVLRPRIRAESDPGGSVRCPLETGANGGTPPGPRVRVIAG